MGPGTRRDTLDDHFGYQNWEKRTQLAIQFLSWATNIADKREKAVLLFLHYDGAVKDDNKRAWKKAVEDWEHDQHNPNPYESAV
ncbi:hypothetical protein VKT23_009483 [Stygiomarasmius scandens]|uniref:Uncharacterized protein n=1 Tax=Marasmiellus scandens TaxID=2682957 RepID=A0ABR1JJS8_9AGAR